MAVDWSRVWADVMDVSPNIREMVRRADVGEWTVEVGAFNYPPRITLRCALLPSDRRRAIIPGTSHAANVTDDEFLQVSTLAAAVAERFGFRAKREWGVTDCVLFLVKPRYEEYEVRADEATL